ncbi:MAG: hypothetical protein ACK5H1_10160 [Tenacibaculum sp.]
MIKKLFLIFFCVMSFLGYSQSYTIFQNKFSPFRQSLPDNFNLVKSEIPTKINIFFMKDNSINVANLKSMPNKGNAFIHGKKIINKNFSLYLYSTEYKFTVKGYLLLASSKYLLGYVKVYEHSYGPDFFRSYIINNNVISVLTHDEYYDIDIDDGMDNSKCSYSVLSITEKGSIINLNRNESIKFLKENKQKIN